MNEYQKVSCFNRGKMSIHTIFQVQVHQRLSTFQSGVFDRQGMADSALLLVRSPVSQTPCERVNWWPNFRFGGLSFGGLFLLVYIKNKRGENKEVVDIIQYGAMFHVEKDAVW